MVVVKADAEPCIRSLQFLDGDPPNVLPERARFRIAINFPDLAMMGDNSFMNIMGAPDAITAALRKIAGG